MYWSQKFEQFQDGCSNDNMVFEGERRKSGGLGEVVMAVVAAMVAEDM